MSDTGQTISPEWLKDRLKRHFSELSRLALPAVMMRIGVMGLSMVDTALVGHYATEHLAWLNLANQSVIMFALVVGIGLLGGITVYVANAIGEDNPREAGRVWRRNLPFTVIVGFLILAAIWPADYWLALLGQTDEKAREAGHLIRILAVGVPGHLLFLNSTMFLEGIKRAEVGFYLMLGANVINLVLDYVLIFGAFGFPEMGAAGSAWTSTVIRWCLAGAAFTYVWYAPSVRGYGTRKPHGQKWAEWRDQRHMGYASAVSLAAEVLAFSALAVFAGWLGTVPLAAHGVVYQVLGVPLMISIGIGVATSVRTGIAYSRRDRADTALAGLSGVVLNFIVTGLFALGIYVYTGPLLGIFTKDERIVVLLLPFAIVYTFGMIFDAAQMVASAVLRGYRETWWPTVLQGFSFAFVMLPACYVLAFPMGHGLQGLMEGMLIGVVISFALQMVRFYHLSRTKP
ncbi:MATE family efflux transporter [Kordiimonas aestuarii]|uniref:MATE family efflux transporter n=1 Tax=Kordiimonas aestuarii TaxID=1005925 RepID=UPI0021CEC238|nr:MATE family efflux transporter [Kordiimonas aestuarii]